VLEQGLAYIPFDMVSPCHPPAEGDAKVRLVVVRHQGLLSAGEIGRMSFLFIDLIVPALTPRIYCSESALQFAENTTFVFLYHVNTDIVREQSKVSSSCRRGIIYI
jgi:hypothetical protein